MKDRSAEFYKLRYLVLSNSTQEFPKKLFMYEKNNFLMSHNWGVYSIRKALAFLCRVELA